ncbi:MAG TPA: thioesterase domain-containing protein, partial [Myxococcaceae bacterium]|nr:thioesterase domain-containing protein [Myxococcaceae bacterium]
MELDRLWFPFRRPRPNARVRLFCFPHAGGGASAYRQWADLVPEWVEICAVQLPGRETRFGERPFEALAPLLDAVMPAVRL